MTTPAGGHRTQRTVPGHGHHPTEPATETASINRDETDRQRGREKETEIEEDRRRDRARQRQMEREMGGDSTIVRNRQTGKKSNRACAHVDGTQAESVEQRGHQHTAQQAEQRGQGAGGGWGHSHREQC